MKSKITILAILIIAMAFLVGARFGRGVDFFPVHEKAAQPTAIQDHGNLWVDTNGGFHVVTENNRDNNFSTNYINIPLVNFHAGASTFIVMPYDCTLTDLNLVSWDDDTVGVTFYKKNKAHPTALDSEMFAGVSTVAGVAGTTCFDDSPAITGATTFQKNDVILVYAFTMTSGNTITVTLGVRR